MSPTSTQKLTGHSVMVDQLDFKRLEDKVDRVVEALNKLVVVEERLANQGIRLGNLETETAVLRERLVSIDKKVDQWVNRGIGVWAVVVIVATLAFKFFPLTR